MKKIFTLALSAMFLLGGVNVFGQEEDVTNYITNPGFDEDLTWTSDGSTKEIVNTDKELSSRSYGYLAADSTVYAFGRGTRPDGMSPAWNGFFGQIEGWTKGDQSYTGKSYYPYGGDSPEWVYFGSMPYDLGNTAIPCADDGTTFFAPPSSKPETDNGDDNIAFLYLRAGWGGAATYKQVVSLPCAQYRLEYWAINLNPSASNGENLSRVVCRKDEFKDETGFNDTEWTKHVIEFTPTSDFTIEFGFKSSGGSGSNPFLCIDAIKLYRIGDADAEELLRADITDEVDELYNMMGEEPYANYKGLLNEMSDAIGEAEDADGEEAMTAALKEIKAFKQMMIDLKETLETYEASMVEAEALLDAAETYPGISDFEKALEDIATEMDDATSDLIEGIIDELTQAMQAYYMSQEATADNPADYSFLIQNPYFTTAKATPTITRDADGAIESVTYPNEADYTAGSAPSDATSEGWYKAGTSEGDQRLNFVQGRVCWNAWRQNADDVAVATDLVDLPNGYYTVSAEMITQSAYVSNQHVYAKSNLGSAVSPSLTSGNWDDTNTGTWDYLTTEKVLVNDGKLTIGALGSALDGSTDQTGWFCVTNFRLMYYGKATDEEIAAALTARYNEADAIAEAMHLAADQAAVKEAIAAAKAIENLDSLNAAIDIAEASEKEYNGIMVGTYAALQDSVANNANYSADAAKLVKVPVDYMTAYLGSAEATYKNTGAITTILRYYRDTLIPALQSAEATKAAISAANGKAVIEGTIASVVAALAEYTDSTAYLDEQVDYLKKAINLAEMADIDISDGADVTAYITNPTIDDTYAKGWTISKIVGDGNGAKTGQQYDGGSGYYMDTWNAAGGLRATWYQVLDVPNGTYTIKNIMRAPGTGAYLFLSDKAPITTGEGDTEVLSLDPTATTVLAEAKNVNTNLTQYLDKSLQAEAGGDSISTAADIYGELWMNAIDELIASGMPIEKARTLDDGTLYPLRDQIEDYLAEDPILTDAQKANIAIVEANSGNGRGWFHNSIASFEVTNHVLVVGVTCDYAFVNKTEEDAFTGAWFSADNFTLTLDKAGNNEGWDPTTAIANVETATSVKATAIYSITGARLNGLQKGINIVKRAGTVKKVFVK
ncbi:MAG: hypothetical protein IJP82_00180 [Bacteroidaceae bacterium]|nr:hypothetical protein [Bacteroidaceae bacterium]